MLDPAEGQVSKTAAGIKGGTVTEQPVATLSDEKISVDEPDALRSQSHDGVQYVKGHPVIRDGEPFFCLNNFSYSNQISQRKRCLQLHHIG
jgi:hypothetical protein